MSDRSLIQSWGLSVFMNIPKTSEDIQHVSELVVNSTVLRAHLDISLSPSNAHCYLPTHFQVITFTHLCVFCSVWGTLGRISGIVNRVCQETDFLMMGFGDRIAHHSRGHEEPTVKANGVVPTSSITYEESHLRFAEQRQRTDSYSHSLTWVWCWW